MPITCAICSDNVETTPQDPAALPGTACTPCGHMFHQFCIEKWLGGTLSTSKSCPLCRKQVPRGKCLPLYLNIQEATMHEDPDDVRCNHGVEIHSLKKQLSDTKSQIEEANLLQRTLTDDLERERALLQSERVRKQHFEFKYRKLESISTYAEELKKKNETQEQELKALGSLKRALEAVREDAEYYEDFDWPLTVESLQQLKDQKQLFTNELKKASNARSATLKDFKRMQEEHKSLKKKYREMEMHLKAKDDEIANLKVALKPTINDSVIEVFSPSPLPPPAARKRKNDELPAKSRLEDKFQENDEDDCLLLPFHGPTKTKLGKKSQSSDDLLLERPKKSISKPASTATLTNDDSFLSKKKTLPKKKYFDDDEDEMSPFRVKSSLVGVAIKSRLVENKKKLVPGGYVPRVPKPSKVIYQK